MKYNKNYDNYSDILINMPQFEKAETIRFSDVRNNTLNETVGVEKINLPVQKPVQKTEPVEPVDVHENHEQPVEHQQPINKPIERVKQMDKLDLERENIMNIINSSTRVEQNKVKGADIDSLIDNSSKSEQTSNKTEKRVTRRGFRLFKNVS